MSSPSARHDLVLGCCLLTEPNGSGAGDDCNIAEAGTRAKRLAHKTRSPGAATMRALCIRPEWSPVSWDNPTPISASRLLAELIGYLGGSTLDIGARARAEAVLVDLLQPAAMSSIDLRLPVGGPARQVAEAMRECPADKRTLAQWGRRVGASERTLARGFAVGTGLPFGRWRTLARLRAALPLLATGESVGNVAHRVGYETPSAFVAASGAKPASPPRHTSTPDRTCRVDRI